MKMSYKVCSRCVMDNRNNSISFDDNGICNYCLDFDANKSFYRYNDKFPSKFYEIGNVLKSKGKNSKYDCIIGLSGGVDSSYVAYLAVKKLGLKPLAIHFDNGWNSDIAIKNVEAVVNSLKIDLETYIVDWEEFRDLQRAFLFASVIDIEMLSDHAIKAANYQIARKYRIRYSLSGGNYVTEHGMPSGWYYTPKEDLRNIKDIAKKFGKVKLKSFPKLSLFKYKILSKSNLTYESIHLLDKMNYSRSEAIGVLEKELGWKNYGGKHHESFITKFYQEYILPKKFNVDKRKVHLSALIRNEEMTREDAIVELQTEINQTTMEQDIKYFLKKMKLTTAEFETIMKASPKNHREFKSDMDIIEKIRPLLAFKRRG